ncbi:MULTISPECIES: alpha/beta fold hydrolase [Actinomadura]|uniref:AB hydrolase-1 domain-containing protein n=1 Tax=Actinomadura miaoliensis TaxID=430685 RepID=A0ABP7VQD3_9ACTN
MGIVLARGVRFHVVDMGTDDGEPVVMLHGLFTGSIATWYFTVAPALARTRPVRLLDWRGHGLSERPPTGYDTATMAADLAALTADLPAFAVVGHSYGAAVAVRFARAHPGRLTRLALIDPPFTQIDLKAAKGLVRFDGEGCLAQRAAALATETSVLADLAAESLVTAEELRGLGDLPVLTVVGSRSPFRRSADLVGRALPASRRHVLDGGHDLHITARAALTRLLAEFLEDAADA